MHLRVKKVWHNQPIISLQEKASLAGRLFLGTCFGSL